MLLVIKVSITFIHCRKIIISQPGWELLYCDGERYEIKDSWLIGNGGNQVKVNGLTSDGNFFYAATEEGLKKSSR